MCHITQNIIAYFPAKEKRKFPWVSRNIPKRKTGDILDEAEEGRL